MGFFRLSLVLAVGTVFQLVHVEGNDGGSPTKMAASRMSMACSVQPNSTVLEWFAGCLSEKGLPYKLPDVFKPCTDVYTGKNDLGTWDGIWDVTCMGKCSDNEKLAECVVENIKKAIDGKDLVKVSADAVVKCEACVKEIGEKLAKAAPAGAGR